jgi:hypothetical protein
MTATVCCTRSRPELALLRPREMTGGDDASCEATEAAATAAARKAIERRRERLASTRDCRSHRSGVFDRLTRHLPTRMD